MLHSIDIPSILFVNIDIADDAEPLKEVSRQRRATAAEFRESILGDRRTQLTEC